MRLKESEIPSIFNNLEFSSGVDFKRHAEEDALFENYQQIIEQNLLKSLETLPLNFKPMSEYHFSSQGKLIRSKLVLDIAATSSAPVEHFIDWAIAIELIHNASLVHDDICDKDSHRRSQLSLHRYYGASNALCFGDGLIALAFKQVAYNPICLSLLASAVTQICNAQISEFSQIGAPSWDQYTTIAIGKTAPMLEIAVVGALAIAGDDPDDAICKEFLNRIGLCYQLINDLNNFAGTDGANSPCSDLANARPNAVIACFKETLNARQTIRFDAWCDNIRSAKIIADTTETREWWVSIKNSTAFECVINHAEQQLDFARKSLEDLPYPLAKVLCQLLVWVEAKVANKRIQSD
jgi:geranylgeranyl pyrophosphate synthase